MPSTLVHIIVVQDAKADCLQNHIRMIQSQKPQNLARFENNKTNFFCKKNKYNKDFKLLHDNRCRSIQHGHCTIKSKSRNTVVLE